MSEIVQTKLIYQTEKGTELKAPVTLEYKDGRIIFRKSPFGLKNEIKCMTGSHWHGRDNPPKKYWSVDDNFRNQFQLHCLMGENVYEWFERPLVEYNYREYHRDGVLSPPMPHQFDMANHGLTYHYQIWGAEMGVGKTLSAQMVIENAGLNYWYWVGPKTSLPNIQREFAMWGFDETCATIDYMTYERLVRIMDEWEEGNPLPQGVIFDESSRLKTATSQRSKAAQKLADLIRAEYTWDGYVIEMSGTPSPKRPTDWWSQCLPSDTWVLTEKGPRQIGQLIDTPSTVRVHDRSYPTSGFSLTGHREVYLLTTNEGYSIRATADHRIQKTDGSWQQLGYLQPGDHIALANHNTFTWTGELTHGDGWLLGFLIGDGNLYNKDGLHARLPFYDIKRSLVEYACECIHDSKYTPKGVDPVCIHHNYISKLARKYGFNVNKCIPASFESHVSSECLRGFLQGFFDADGSVDYNRLRITLSQVDKNRLIVVQRMLTYFGIRSKLQMKRKNAKLSYIDGRFIKSPEIMYILHITGDDAVAFAKRVGFRHSDKAKLLRRRLERRHKHYTPTYATVKTITKDGMELVYDATVNEAHCFAANGLVAHNCEVAWPGFLKEGSVKALEKRLAFQVQKTFDSGTFWQTIGWRDDENKCDVCGETYEEGSHELDLEEEFHKFVPTKNEVAYMFERLQGLALIKHKKDCLDLPDKRYRKIECKPTSSLLRVAKTIVDSASNAMVGMTLLRELSDGFQYRNVDDGTRTCDHCSDGIVDEWFDPENEFKVFQAIDMLDEELTQRLEKRKVTCPKCHGSQEMKKTKRITKTIPCPKEKALKGLLGECEETGRIVIFAGFTGSVDRCVDICHNEGWAVVRCDGRGFQVTLKDGKIITDIDSLDFWADLENYPEVAFVAHPESGGMSLTLVEARMAVYWSNSFKPEYRVHSEDRIHRKGMDENLGCTIVDLIHLPTDVRVIDIIRENRKLELMTMGEITKGISWEK